MNLLNQVKPGSYFLPQNQRQHFKNPLGQIIKNRQDIVKLINKLSRDDSTPKVITVGDVTTKAFVELSFIPDIAIIDIAMPKVDGMEVLERIRKDDKLCELPVIILTTTVRPQEIEQCHQLG